MEEQTKSLSDYLAIAKRRAKFIIIPFALLSAITVAVAVLLPPIYQSRAMILIESQQVPMDLVQTTVTSFVDERIQVIKQRALSSSVLNGFINKYKLHAEDRKKQPQSVILDRVRESIEVEAVQANVINPRGGRRQKATIAFTVAFEDEVPRVAQAVTNELVTLFLEENTRTRTKGATETADFLTQQASKLKSKIATIETNISTYKLKNRDLLPDMRQLNMEALTRAENDLREAERSVTRVGERKIFVNVQLKALKDRQAEMNSYRQRAAAARTAARRAAAKYAAAEAAVRAAGRVGSAPLVRISRSEIQLDDLKREYTRRTAVYGESHPDVANVKRQIEALERSIEADKNKGGGSEKLQAARAELAQAKQRYSPQHPDVVNLLQRIKILEEEEASNNSKTVDKAASPLESAALLPPELAEELPVQVGTDPAIIKLESELVALPGRKVILEAEIERHRQKIAQLEARSQKFPNVERGLTTLQREYNDSLNEYENLRLKKQDAVLAQHLEAERKGEKFTLLEPPLLPEKPEKPDRIKIILGGMVISLMAGLGVGIAAESADKGIRGPNELAAVINTPPIAIIPYIETEQDKRRHSRRVMALLLFAIVAMAGATYAVHVFVRPLDVLWPLLLRRMGIF